MVIISILDVHFDFLKKSWFVYFPKTHIYSAIFILKSTLLYSLILVKFK